MFLDRRRKRILMISNYIKKNHWHNIDSQTLKVIISMDLIYHWVTNKICILSFLTFPTNVKSLDSFPSSLVFFFLFSSFLCFTSFQRRSERKRERELIRGDAIRLQLVLVNFPCTWPLRCRVRENATAVPISYEKHHICAEGRLAGDLDPFHRTRPHTAEVKNNL